MPRVVVVGDIALDVLVATGNAAMVPGADVPARIRTTAGGAGANTAAWLAHLGADVTLVSRVGDDVAGRELAAGLRAAGIGTALAVDPHAPTCAVVVLVDGDGERTMLSDRGAAARLDPGDLPPLHDADHLHLSGYVLLDPPSRPAGLAALAAARAAGVTMSVDPQAAPALTPEFTGWVRGTDLLLPNADELAALTGSADPASAAALLTDVGAVAVTAGACGASWVDRGGAWHAAAERADGADATGAGDAFDAGLLVAWLRGAGPEEALRAGCAAGALAVSGRGGRPGISAP